MLVIEIWLCSMAMETRALNQATGNIRKAFSRRFYVPIESGGSCRTFKITICDLEERENIKYLPHAFTENGVAMLSSVLNSERG